MQPQEDCQDFLKLESWFQNSHEKEERLAKKTLSNEGRLVLQDFKLESTNN